MRKLVAIIFMMIIASNTYFGMYNEKGEKVTDIKEVLERQNLISSEVTEDELQENKVQENEIQEEIAEITEVVAEEKIEEQPKVQESKTEVVIETKPVTTTKKETKVVEIPKVEETRQLESTPKVIEEKKETKTITCEEQHSRLQGNCSIWFSTKEQAVTYYDKLVSDKDKEIQEKMKNAKPEDRDKVYREETLKCPYGYEMISCPVCNKWTLNMYYR